MKDDIEKYPDSELVELIAADDKDAFKKLYYRYYPPLHRFAFMRLRSSEIVNDLIQNLFLKLWLNRRALDPRKSIKAYLYKSLNNSIINHKKLFSTQTLPIDEIVEHPDAYPSEPDSSIDMHNALEKLSPKLKEVFLLSRYDGYKYSEIAEILEISDKAVEKRMTLALSKLRTFLKK